MENDTLNTSTLYHDDPICIVEDEKGGEHIQFGDEDLHTEVERAAHVVMGLDTEEIVGTHGGTHPGYEHIVVPGEDEDAMAERAAYEVLGHEEILGMIEEILGHEEILGYVETSEYDRGLDAVCGTVCGEEWEVQDRSEYRRGYDDARAGRSADAPWIFGRVDYDRGYGDGLVGKSSVVGAPPRHLGGARRFPYWYYAASRS